MKRVSKGREVLLRRTRLSKDLRQNPRVQVLRQVLAVFSRTLSCSRMGDRAGILESQTYGRRLIPCRLPCPRPVGFHRGLYLALKYRPYNKYHHRTLFNRFRICLQRRNHHRAMYPRVIRSLRPHRIPLSNLLLKWLHLNPLRRNGRRVCLRR